MASGKPNALSSIAHPLPHLLPFSPSQQDAATFKQTQSLAQEALDNQPKVEKMRDYLVARGRKSYSLDLPRQPPHLDEAELKLLPSWGGSLGSAKAQADRASKPDEDDKKRNKQARREFEKATANHDAGYTKK